jgi:sec-independent protein translocase protein TatC
MAIPFLNRKNLQSSEMSFFDHIDVLRKHLFRSALAIVIGAVFVFFNKTFIFDTVLFGPKNSTFITYSWMCKVGQWLHLESLCVTVPSFNVVSNSLSGQFMAHIQLSFVIGFLLAIPYLFWEVWQFIKPALLPAERKASQGFVFYASSLFIIGAMFGYFFLCPFSIAFLASYSISANVVNLPTLDDYIDFVSSMVLATGITFELPILLVLLGKIGIITALNLKQFRRYAILLVLILAAVITPSSDIFTQVLVAIPIYALYELSIFLVANAEKKSAANG